MSAAWDSDREARNALSQIVSDPQFGPSALSKSQTLSNLFKDLLPGAPRESSVLVAAAGADVAGILQRHVATGLDIATACNLTAAYLGESTGLAPEACIWAVGEVALALGMAPAGAPTTVQLGGRAGGADPNAVTLIAPSPPQRPPRGAPGNRQALITILAVLGAVVVLIGILWLNGAIFAGATAKFFNAGSKVRTGGHKLRGGVTIAVGLAALIGSYVVHRKSRRTAP